MYYLKQATLESIMMAARNNYPNEFIALLGSTQKNNVIDELVVLPAQSSSEMALLHTDLKPADKSIVGSVHSHPTPNATPSRGDLASFPGMGDIHAIIGYPFKPNNLKMYNAQGEQIEWRRMR